MGKKCGNVIILDLHSCHLGNTGVLRLKNAGLKQI
jgi:hypothetical protein